jgi:hypothetical protein
LTEFQIGIGPKIKGKFRKNFYQILIRLLMAVVMAILAALVPNLQIFISFLGLFAPAH